MNMTNSTFNAGNTRTAGWGATSNYRPGGGGVGYVSDFYKKGGTLQRSNQV